MVMLRLLGGDQCELDWHPLVLQPCAAPNTVVVPAKMAGGTVEAGECQHGLIVDLVDVPDSLALSGALADPAWRLNLDCSCARAASSIAFQVAAGRRSGWPGVTLWNLSDMERHHPPSPSCDRSPYGYPSLFAALRIGYRPGSGRFRTPAHAAQRRNPACPAC